MCDPQARRNAALGRLRQQLKKKKESLADDFEFKMFIVFHFKDKKKRSALFEMADILPIMTNNYEETIMQGVKDDAYTYESCRELLEKDVVQLHAPRWQSLRTDVIGCTTNVDFFLWPRNDIERMECLLFSRWKGDVTPFKPVRVNFEFQHMDIERHLVKLVGQKEKCGLIVNNDSESVFLFIDKHQIQTKNNKMVMFKLSSICLYLPQDQLTYWGPGSIEQSIAQYLF